MPRSAAQPEEQALQGNLFGASEPAQTSVPTGAAELDDLSDDSLSADAAARPRQRQADINPPSEPIGDPNDNSDGPAWSHHRDVDPTRLTPMLRHYVELKAEHPDRVLLYRLGDFFECFFEDAVELSRVLELTLTGKEGARRSAACPWPASPTTPQSVTAPT